MAHFLLLKRALLLDVPYIKWAYKIRFVSHLICKIREVMRPWTDQFKDCDNFLLADKNMSIGDDNRTTLFSNYLY